jgi:serine O-acetyltransferase
MSTEQSSGETPSSHLRLSSLLELMREDVRTTLERDAAARSTIEVFLCYAGLHAIWIYRISHWLWRYRWFTLARFLSQIARWMTGVEIHPAAVIGRRLFIDHGMGVVIGETTVVGDDVLLYQGVTLGGTGKDVGKRHPTIQNGVVIGTGAKVLGNITVGENCRIGANSVVLREVDANCTVVGVPGHIVLQNGKRIVITDPKQINDPLSQALNAVIDRIGELNERLSRIEGQPAANEDYLAGVDKIDSGIEYFI